MYVGVAVGAWVGVSVAVRVGVGIDVSVGVVVALAVALEVVGGVDVAVRVLVDDGVGVGVDPVGVAVGVSASSWNALIWYPPTLSVITPATIVATGVRFVSTVESTFARLGLNALVIDSELMGAPAISHNRISQPTLPSSAGLNAVNTACGSDIDK